MVLLLVTTRRLQDPRPTMVIGSFSNFRDFNQAGNGRFGGPLVAQNHTYVRFEVRLNPVEFDFIRDHPLDRRSVACGDAPKFRLPNNSIAVKAAWKIIKEEELPAAQSRFYLVDAMVLDPVSQHLQNRKNGFGGAPHCSEDLEASAMGLVFVRAG